MTMAENPQEKGRNHFVCSAICSKKESLSSWNHFSINFCSIWKICQQMEVSPSRNLIKT